MSLEPFVKCARCGTLRPRRAMADPSVVTMDWARLLWGESAQICADFRWCSQAAGVGQGRVDADVGGPDEEASPHGS